MIRIKKYFLKAIIIETEVFKIMMIHEYIEKNVAAITVVNTMQDALQLIESERFEYVFLNHHICDVRSTHFISKIREKQKNTKCISISNDFYTERTFKELGYDDVFKFPFRKSVERIFE